jgi:hypothetical protein
MRFLIYLVELFRWVSSEHGCKPENFPGDGAYFAAPDSRTLADDWESRYHEGVLEVQMPRQDYTSTFSQFEHIYPDLNGFTEVVIPPDRLERLNQYPRIWHLS